MSPSARRVLCMPQRGQVRPEVEGLCAEIAARGKSGGGARHGVRRMRRRVHPLRLRDQHGKSQGSDDAAEAVYWEIVMGAPNSDSAWGGRTSNIQVTRDHLIANPSMFGLNVRC